MGCHLPVGSLYHHLGHQALDVGSGVLQGLHPVVQEEHLAVPLHLAPDGLGHQVGLELVHHGLYGMAVVGSGAQDRQIADLEHGHVQGTRYGRGSQGKAVHIGLHLLEPFLVLDAETLFLVDNEQAKILEADILLQDAVGAYEHIDAAFLDTGQHLFWSLRSTKRDSMPKTTGRPLKRSMQFS
jgi:hypothetical protein